MANTALTIISDAEGKVVVRFLRRNSGHVSGYSQTLLSSLAGVEIRTDRQPDERTFHAMGFLAPAVIARLMPANGDTFILSPESESAADYTFSIFERDGDVYLKCEDSGGVMYETNASKSKN